MEQDIIINNENISAKTSKKESKANIIVDSQQNNINTIIIKGNSIKDNCINIEGFSFRLTNKEIKDIITINYTKTNNNVQIVEIK